MESKNELIVENIATLQPINAGNLFENVFTCEHLRKKILGYLKSSIEQDEEARADKEAIEAEEVGVENTVDDEPWDIFSLRLVSKSVDRSMCEHIGQGNNKIHISINTTLNVTSNKKECVHAIRINNRPIRIKCLRTHIRFLSKCAIGVPRELIIDDSASSNIQAWKSKFRRYLHKLIIKSLIGPYKSELKKVIGMEKLCRGCKVCWDFVDKCDEHSFVTVRKLKHGYHGNKTFRMVHIPINLTYDVVYYLSTKASSANELLELFTKQFVTVCKCETMLFEVSHLSWLPPIKIVFTLLQQWIVSSVVFKEIGPSYLSLRDMTRQYDPKNFIDDITEYLYERASYPCKSFVMDFNVPYGMDQDIFTESDTFANNIKRLLYWTPSDNVKLVFSHFYNVLHVPKSDFQIKTKDYMPTIVELVFHLSEKNNLKLVIELAMNEFQQADFDELRHLFHFENAMEFWTLKETKTIETTVRLDNGFFIDRKELYWYNEKMNSSVCLIFSDVDPEARRTRKLITK